MLTSIVSLRDALGTKITHMVNSCPHVITSSMVADNPITVERLLHSKAGKAVPEPWLLRKRKLGTVGAQESKAQAR